MCVRGSKVRISNVSNLEVSGIFPNFQVKMAKGLTTGWQADGNLIKYADDTTPFLCFVVNVGASNMEKRLKTR